MDSLEQQLRPKQKQRLQETADLLLEIYKTLAEMRYIDPAGIRPGPHDIETNGLRRKYEEHGLDASIIYLYSILPYIDVDLAGNADFFMGSSFADFRTGRDIKRGRDPLYACPEGDDFNAENGPYMRPWMTPLSMLGNHRSVIIYDALKHRIWILDQENVGSIDPNINQFLTDDGEVDDDEDDDDEEDEDEDLEENLNENSLDEADNRPAGDVLRDIKTWYRTLEQLPGGGEEAGPEWSHWEDMDLAALYRQHGWPDNFDGDAFEVDQMRRRCAIEAKSHASDRLEHIRRKEMWQEHLARQLSTAREELEKATTEDDRWLAQYQVWANEKAMERTAQEAARAKEEFEQRNPGGKVQRDEDLPLWELEMVRNHYESQQEDMERYREEVEEAEDAEEKRRCHSRMRLAERMAGIFKRTFEASKADAERLRPGVTLQDVAGVKGLGKVDPDERIANLNESIQSMQDEAIQVRELMTQLPEEAVKAKAKAATDLARVEDAIERYSSVLKGVKDAVAKVDNADTTE
ncbi:hypothetical protein GQ53DRAFT_792419 [Thozetella sp. PMI_491]|nr:hypothetical protein GQ53DRAFT_792419 [Thozetella sp. PMI_491]